MISGADTVHSSIASRRPPSYLDLVEDHDRDTRLDGDARLDHDTEHFESIPWSTLMPEDGDRRTTWINIAGGVVLALVAVAIVWRFVGSDGATVVTLPPADVAPQAQIVETTVTGAADTEPASSSATLAPSAAAPPPAGAEPGFGSVLTEADLMAVVPELDVRAAVMRAEWFVTDYFTVDGDTASLAGVLEALPVMPRGPVFPHQGDAEAPQATGVSYVEWARATDIDPLGAGRFRVVVLYRTLAGQGDAGIVRQPVRAVAVDVEVADGATAVLDLPTPLPPPVALGQPNLAMDTATEVVPLPVTAAALDVVRAAGYEAEVIGSSFVLGRWRLTIAGTDGSGLAFPLRVWDPTA